MDLEEQRRILFKKWKLAIFITLYKRCYRFNSLKHKLKVSPNVLIENLKEMKNDGLVLNENGSYCLTERGKKIAALVLEIINPSS